MSCDVAGMNLGDPSGAEQADLDHAAAPLLPPPIASLSGMSFERMPNAGWPLGRRRSP
jgi:hypothetical protein